MKQIASQNKMQFTDYLAARGIKPQLFVVNVLLLVLLLVSALGVIYSTFQSRQLFSELQQSYRKEIAMEEQWGRLLLEQSTWASHARIEELARTKLNMAVPEAAAIRVIRE